MSGDDAVLAKIDELVNEEHALERAAAGKGLDAAGRERLRHLEVRLDQYWDLLRQRRARREYGQDPDAAAPRGEGTVEGYLQ